MKHRIITAVAAGILLSGCSTEGGASRSAGDDAPKRASATAPSPSPSKSEAPLLSKKWVPKLNAAIDKGTDDICAEVGSPGCVEHLTDLFRVVLDVETAIEDSEAEVAYPRSMRQIDDLKAASEAYVAAECKGRSEATLGDSACAGYAAALLVGPGILAMTLPTDENSR